MLQYFPSGPDENGQYIVSYLIPGCHIITAACLCKTYEQADKESIRMNQVQIEKERQIKIDRELRGLYGVYPDLRR